MGSNKKYDNKAVLARLKTVCSPAIKLPTRVQFTMEGDSCSIYMPDDLACDNLQNDPAAFDGWALALRTWLGCDVSISWTPAKDVKDRDYQRFLYRMIRFHEAVNWFYIASDCEEYLDASLVLEPDGMPKKAPGYFLVNVPGKRKEVKDDDVARELTELTENELENQFFLRPQRLLDCIDWNANIMKQIPVGVFAEEVSKSSSVFPGVGGKVDLGAVDESRGVALFELKKPGNRKVGSISELLFYAHVVRDIQLEILGYEERKQGVNERRIRKASSVTGFILADQLHPLLDNEALFEILNLAFQDRNETFGFIKYSGMSDEIECERVYPVSFMASNGTMADPGSMSLPADERSELRRLEASRRHSKMELTEEEQGILKLYGQIMEEEHHDWHDVDWLEGFVLSRYERETAMEALKGVLNKLGVIRKDYGRSARTIGEMMQAFIRSRFERRAEDNASFASVLFQLSCPHCGERIKRKSGVSVVCPHCSKEFH